MPTVAFLSVGSPEVVAGRVGAFRKGLSETGYVEEIVLILPESCSPIRSIRVHEMTFSQGGRGNAFRESKCLSTMHAANARSRKHRANWLRSWSCGVSMC